MAMRAASFARAVPLAPAARVAALLLGLLLAACSTHRDHLNRGQRYYDENEYEKALALWRALEPDADSLSEQERARYAYLRGMTDYRLGYRSHARHWLAIAKATEKKYPGGFEEDWHHRADEALEDLNKDVFGVERFESEASESDSNDGNSDEGKEATAPESKGSKGCRTDSDCASDQVCVSKACVLP
jgi:hypothetical protein